jgi:hypothetical protein
MRNISREVKRALNENNDMYDGPSGFSMDIYEYDEDLRNNHKYYVWSDNHSTI